MTVKTEHPHVVKVKGVRGGRAVVRGTRIPVWLLVALGKEGSSPEEILEHYPQLFDALSYYYYYDHREEIEAQLREQDLPEEELARLQAQWPPQSSS